jgi:hypothetical protein
MMTPNQTKKKPAQCGLFFWANSNKAASSAGSIRCPLAIQTKTPNTSKVTDRQQKQAFKKSKVASAKDKRQGQTSRTNVAKRRQQGQNIGHPNDAVAIHVFLTGR